MEIDDDPIPDDDKQAIQNEIFGKMQQMNDMFIDLCENEIDQIQDILDDSADEDGSEDFFEWLPTSSDERFPVPFTSKMEMDDNEQSYVYSGDSDVSSINQNENGDLDSNQIIDQGTYVNNDHTGPGVLNADEQNDQVSDVNRDDTEQNTHEEAINDTLNSVESESESNVNIQNNSGAIPFFSPPSTSATNTYQSQIPSHFTRLDPNLRGFVGKHDKSVNSKEHVNANNSQMTLEEMLQTVKLNFPGICIYVSRSRYMSYFVFIR